MPFPVVRVDVEEKEAGSDKAVDNGEGVGNDAGETVLVVSGGYLRAGELTSR